MCGPSEFTEIGLKFAKTHLSRWWQWQLLFFYFDHENWGRWSNLTVAYIFQMGWFNHQSVMYLHGVYFFLGGTPQTPHAGRAIIRANSWLANHRLWTLRWEKGFVFCFFRAKVVRLMEEILHHMGWCWNPVNNGINYLPQLVQDFFHQQ